MIDLPVGMALVAVESAIECNFECVDEAYTCPLDCCMGCDMKNETIRGLEDSDTCSCICCNSKERKDKKAVIIKLVNYLRKND